MTLWWVCRLNPSSLKCQPSVFKPISVAQQRRICASASTVARHGWPANSATLVDFAQWPVPSVTMWHVHGVLGDFTKVINTLHCHLFPHPSSPLWYEICSTWKYIFTSGIVLTAYFIILTYIEQHIVMQKKVTNRAWYIWVQLVFFLSVYCYQSFSNVGLSRNIC